MDSIRAGVQPNTHRAALEDVRSSPESFIRVHQHHAPVNTMKPKSLCVPRLGLFEDTDVRYRRQVDSGSPEQSLDQPAESPKDPRFTLLQPERSPYQHLVEDDSQLRLKEEKKTKKKEKYKKYKKNVGKALRYSWKCLMLGLQNFTVGYSTPLSAAATIVPDFHSGGAWS
ncbi:uncharacterized protein si:dkey-126g1.9 [Pimephales promelas]|uniref:uncharacterized protein si:dkey-126g1.9 n=1 Tax=Pimephales promelas TaxID=90988 RepID=UPI0019557C04|nr:uncharacterized protein si:dkey-126g1.9 [Pimephales promelas]KAG1961030.1 hypothetical protein F2P79_005321 [Pimephales promelas]